MSKKIWDNSLPGSIKGMLTPSESGSRGQSWSLNKQGNTYDTLRLCQLVFTILQSLAI